MAHVQESLFSASSEPIVVDRFIQPSLHPEPRKSADDFIFTSSDSESEEMSRQPDIILWRLIARECSVSDIKESLLEAWNNPRLSAHVLKNHEFHVASIHGSADKGRKQKRKPNFIDPRKEPQEVTALQQKFDAIRLTSWRLQRHSALFMRATKNWDQNALTRVKPAAFGTPCTSSCEAVITVAVHSRLTWGHGHLYRSSHHALLNSQTLGDLFKAIPCMSRELPDQIRNDRLIAGCERGIASTDSKGCVVCIESFAYGDGQIEADYADKLTALFAELPVERQPVIRKACTTLHDTPLHFLSLRINQPYWLLHEGNCEHFIVIDQIRLQHSSDLRSGYPLTLQVTPPLLDLCRACTKVPAVWSILCDIRLGESPCVLCGPCWRNMGDPHDDTVVVLPLPKYDIG